METHPPIGSFKEEFWIPRFIAELRAQGCPLSRRESPGIKRWAAPASDFLAEWEWVHPEPFLAESGSKVAIVMGSPIVGSRIDKEGAAKSVLEGGRPDPDAMRSLNGEFLIFRFDKADGSLSIVNDRFTSIPLFYCHFPEKGVFRASPYFGSIWDSCMADGLSSIDTDAFFEFFWLQRLLGEKTYLKDAKYLPDASILELRDGRLSISRYWSRCYEKSSRPFRSNAAAMAEFAKASVKRKASDGRRLGHFLSGGMDSRSVLAAFDGNLPTCFTATVSENRELRTAREIALAKGARHIALRLQPDHYSKILRPSSAIIGGMYNYDHGLFLGFHDTVKEYAEVCLHGHGFDYMFQGMYIPGHSWRLFGRTTQWRTIQRPPDDLAGYFIENASYRIKRADIMSFVKPALRVRMEEFRRNSAEEVLKSGRKLTSNSFDLWEYLTFHYLSRHYSYPNHASIASYVEQRTVSFDNSIFDLYLSLPVEHRFYGMIEKACLKMLDPKLARIWSANTNYPVTASRFEQTLHQAAGFLKRRIQGDSVDVPSWKERTWPSRDHAVRDQETLRKEAVSIVSSGVLEPLDFLDHAKLRADIPRWLDGDDVPGVSGDLVQTILTIGAFLKGSHKV